jgi:hypothetical protein
LLQWNSIEGNKREMEHKFRDVLEHDMDMLFLEEFAYSNGFCEIFLDKIGITNATVCLTWQSKTDEQLGESDMTVIFDYNGKKLALLIEDKIDAIAMPEQPIRYALRGDKGIHDGEYDKYYIFIVAPQEYLDKNEKAKEYPNHVSYEEIKEYFERLNDRRSGFKLAQLNLAIEKQKNGYQLIKNAEVTEFWNKYVEYKKQHFPDLNLAVHSDIKPKNGVWPHFRTNKVGTFIYHKSNMGRVDLTYNRQADKIDDIKKFLVGLIGDYYEKGFNVVETGKSCAIRINVPVITFLKSFEEQKDLVNQAFQAVDKLLNLSMKLEMKGIYDLFD